MPQAHRSSQHPVRWRAAVLLAAVACLWSFANQAALKGCAASIAAAPAPAQVPPLADAVRARIDELTAAELAKDNVGGATVGVVIDGRLVWAKGYGLADIEAGTPATADTVYRIGSITKPFTALMLLQLVEQGRVRLSDPVERYFPEINRIDGRPAGSPPVTLIQLATMTSGIAREPEELDSFLVGPVSEWETVLVRALDRTKYAHEPGTRYLYSNIGYAILGAALGRAAGRPYVDYVRERILAPLGMTHTDFVPGESIRRVMAKGYELRDGRPDGAVPAREHAGRGYKVPNGALYSTVADLARFVALMLGDGPEAVLKKETVTDNLSRVSSASGALTSGYGIGFQVSRRGALVTYGHGGSVAGYGAQVVFDPATRTGAIVMCNVGEGKFSPGGLAQRILEVLVQAASPKSANPTSTRTRPSASTATR